MRKLFLSCEHAGNKVPANLRSLFKGADEVLASHRGWDIGALGLFKALVPMAHHFAYESLSRLCIEMNRSIAHPKLFSLYTKDAESEQRAFLLERYHAYRVHFTTAIKSSIEAGHHVLHISVHTFTPVLDGEVRNVDIGLLYDPARKQEQEFCRAWQDQLEHVLPGSKIRMNQPYRGTADGFTTSLRKTFPKNYAGIEIEVNQRFAPLGVMDAKIIAGIKNSLEAVLERP